MTNEGALDLNFSEGVTVLFCNIQTCHNPTEQ